MKYRIRYLPIAQCDILEIAEYITEKLYNPEAAKRQVNRIVEAIRLTSEAPYMYPLHHSAQPLKHDYRKIPVNHYLVFYWVDERKKTITVARVIYGKHDYMKKEIKLF